MMVEDNRKAIEIKEMLRNLQRGRITENTYNHVRQYPNEYWEKGITADAIRELLDMKRELAFCPDPLCYSVQGQDRVNYIYEHADSPNICLNNDDERHFLESVRSYYAMEKEYDDKMACISKLADKPRVESRSERYIILINEMEKKVLMDLLLGKSIVPDSTQSYSLLGQLLVQWDLSDAYHMDDNEEALKWKTGMIMESKNFLRQGTTAKLLIKAGGSIARIKAGLNRYKFDKLRISDVEYIVRKRGTDEYLRCRVDGELQDSRKLSSADIARISLFGETKGLAVKLFKDALDDNREQHQAIDDEKMLERRAMSCVDRLVDIYRNGINEQDKMLLEKSIKNNEIDPFWRKNEIDPPKDKPELQRYMAFKVLVNYIGEIRPGMLTDSEILDLLKEVSINARPMRETEENLMWLPETYFPLVEKSENFADDVVDYAKVIREIGRVTPRMAFNSMDYYLYYCTNNRDILSPAWKFPPNLLSERQWEELQRRHPGVSYSVPHGAFRKDRVSEVQVYPASDNALMIRCKVDGVQQGCRRLSIADAQKYDDKTDKQELATGYFMYAFARESDRNEALRR